MNRLLRLPALVLAWVLVSGFIFTPPPTLWQTGCAAATGSNLGDLTINGGLNAAFDGVTNQAKTASATKASTDGYVGKLLTSPAKVSQAVVYCTNDNGCQHDTQAGETFTIKLWGKVSGSPANATDGVTLGQVTGISDNTPVAAQTITNTGSPGTTYASTWIQITAALGDTQVAELQLTTCN